MDNLTEKQKKDVQQIWALKNDFFDKKDLERLAEIFSEIEDFNLLIRAFGYYSEKQDILQREKNPFLKISGGTLEEIGKNILVSSEAETKIKTTILNIFNAVRIQKRKKKIRELQEKNEEKKKGEKTRKESIKVKKENKKLSKKINSNPKR